MTGSKDDLVPADEFESVSYADDDWLFLPQGTISADSTAKPLSGNAPLTVKFAGSVDIIPPDATYLTQNGDATESTTDIAGLARPGIDDKYSIGAHEVGFQFPSGTVLS